MIIYDKKHKKAYRHLAYLRSLKHHYGKMIREAKENLKKENRRYSTIHGHPVSLSETLKLVFLRKSIQDIDQEIINLRVVLYRYHSSRLPVGSVVTSMKLLEQEEITK